MKDKQFPRSRMDVLWNPRSVAMAGATENVNKWGGIILARMLGQGFEGKVYPVNPKAETIFGVPAVKSILDVRDPVDLAIIVTPARAVPAVMRETAKKGVPAAIVITSGFSETGDEGAAVERDLAAVAEDAGMIFVGPNTMGVYSASARLNCLMAPIIPMPGNAACIAQSGNVGTHMLFRGRLRGLGFGKFVSSGNEGCLSFEDYLWYFGRDPDTSAVLGYLEGLDPGSSFMEIAPAVTREKPVIVLRGGRTGVGADAAASHTGALAGNSAVFEGAMEQAGVIVADSNRQVVELARALELQSVPRGHRVGILTRGGGWGVITSDACAEAGLEVTALSNKTLADLDKLLPPYWSRGNPVDMVAVMSYRAYIDCLDILARDPNVDAVIALGANIDTQSVSTLESLRKLGIISEDQVKKRSDSVREESDLFFNELREYIARSEKPVLTVGRWRETPDWEAGLMMIGEPEDAAVMLAKMARYGDYLDRVGARDRPDRKK